MTALENKRLEGGLVEGGALIECLAKELHWKMERLDPRDGREWVGLSPRERAFYKNCVEHLLRQDCLAVAGMLAPSESQPPRNR